jgi:hypothetical protein
MTTSGRILLYSMIHILAEKQVGAPELTGKGDERLRQHGVKDQRTG